MLTLTPAACDKVRSFMDDFGGDAALRIALVEGSSPFAPQFELELIDPADHEGDDVAFDVAGLAVYVAAASVAALDDAALDYQAGAFNLQLGEAQQPALTGDLAERVAHVLETRVNPGVAAHGGRITLAGVQDGIAYVSMSGGCQGCGLAAVTLRQGVERMLREAIPELAGVRDVTDHAGGANPFYAKQ